LVLRTGLDLCDRRRKKSKDAFRIIIEFLMDGTRLGFDQGNSATAKPGKDSS